MSLTSTQTYTELTASAGQTAFPTGFPFMDAADLEVTIDDVVSGSYSVTGGLGSSGTVTLGTACSGGEIVRITRGVPRTQPLALANQGAFFPSALDRALDRLVMIAQDIEAAAAAALSLEAISRAAADQAIIAAGVPVALAGSAFVTAEGASTALTLAAHLGGLGADVTGFGADPTGVASVTSAFQAACTYAGYRGRVRVPKGTYRLDGTVTIPMGSFGNFQLVLEPGAVINYTGSGYAFDAATAGVAYANVNITGAGEIVGTSSGLAGIRYHAFNKGSIVGVRCRGFTNGDGIFLEGANTIDIINAEITNNKNGVHLRRCRDGSDYGVNACRVLGGHIANNTQWGIFDDASGTGVNGNASNFYASTVEYNGGSGAGTGNIYVQAGDNHTVSCYLEYDGAVNLSPYNIVLGDGSNHPIGTRVVGCMMASGGVGAAVLGSIYDNGTGTLIEGNFEAAAVPALVVGGAGGSQRVVFGNSGYATTVHGGTDNGDTLTIGRSSGLMNSIQPSARGVAFRNVTGQTGPFAVRKRDPGDGYIAYFGDDSVDRVASIKSDGGLSPGNGTGAAQNNAMYMGIGVPGAGVGIDGDFYFRVDTYLIANQRIYIKTSGGWTGIA